MQSYVFIQQPQYQFQAVPTAMSGMGAQQKLLRIVATVNGSDRVIPDIPVNVEIAAKGNVTYSGSTQAMMQAIDAMMQGSKAELEREDYNKMVHPAIRKEHGTVRLRAL